MINGPEGFTAAGFCAHGIAGAGGIGRQMASWIAYAYLPPDRAAIGTRGEVEVFGEWIGFEVMREPLYDPTGSRIRS